MKLKINGNFYELNFGISFINSLDHELGVSVDGNRTDLIGLQNAVPGLATYDPSVLATVIYCAIDKAVSKDIVNKYLENDADLDNLFVDVVRAMSDSKLVNFQLKRITGKTMDQIVKITPSKKSTTSKK